MHLAERYLRRGFAAGWIVFAAAAPARADEDAGEALFLRRNLCEISHALGAIQAPRWVEKQEQNRFLILYPRGHQSWYVQCALEDRGKLAYCEVASAFYSTRDSPVPQARLPALARFGYSLDGSQGNYAKRFELASAPPLAEFMLRSLYESFLDDPSLKLDFTAPMVDARQIREACAPGS